MALLLTGFFTLSEREGAWELLAAALLLTAFFLLCFFSWLWPVLSRFSMGLRALFTASARLACGHILKSTAMALLWGAALWAGLRYVAPLFVLPALCACLGTYLIEPVFREYEEQE